MCVCVLKHKLLLLHCVLLCRYMSRCSIKSQWKSDVQLDALLRKYQRLVLGLHMPSQHSHNADICVAHTLKHYLLTSLSVNCQMPTTKLHVLLEVHIQLSMAAWYSSGGSSDLTAASSLCLFRRHTSLRSSSADSISLLPNKIALIMEGNYAKVDSVTHQHRTLCSTSALLKQRWSCCNQGPWMHPEGK